MDSNINESNLTPSNKGHLREIKTVLIIGLGLMGASLAKSLKLKRPELKILGVDNSYCDRTYYDDGMIGDSDKVLVLSIPTVEYAINNGIIDKGSMTIEDMEIESADLIVLASPLMTYVSIAESIKHRLKPGAIVTDIGSVKTRPQIQLSEIFSPDNVFIGGHPMRGSDKSGIQNSTSKIYDGTVFFLTPKITEEDKLSPEVEKAVEILKQFIENSGMRPYLVPSLLHDRIVAKTSHVPHIMAALMIKPIIHNPEDAYDFIANGFKDTTRIAASNPKMWSDVFITNKEPILEELKDMQREINFFIENIESDNMESLENYLNETCAVRKDLNTKIIRGK